MAYVHKKSSDAARGKSGKWTCYYTGEDGKKHSRVGFTDKGKSERLANHLEAQARLVREGMVNPAERGRREASLRSIADHVEDYRLGLVAKGDGPSHAGHVAGAVLRVLESAGVRSVADLAPAKVQVALGCLRIAKGKSSPTLASARTRNHAMGAVKAFARWLYHAGRIEAVPPGLLALKPYNEKVDRKRVRRALTIAEVEQLLRAAEAGEPLKLSRRGYNYAERWLSGPERAALYRLAMGTGFRADELRTLAPERFDLDGPEPTITVLACYSKNGKESVQPITRELADKFRPFLAGKPEGKPVLDVPEKTAKLLRGDLARAGIPYKDGQGRVADFHALRHSYITHLIQSGANPKVVQTLARHSTITLTLDRYTHVEGADLRKALEGEG